MRLKTADANTGETQGNPYCVGFYYKLKGDRDKTINETN